MSVETILPDEETTIELPVRNPTGLRNRYPSRHYRRGGWVKIRSEEEIRATLDQDGKLDGLSFMPEQVKYCGKKFRIYRRAERVYLDHHYYVVRLKNTVLLDDLRCDGSSHGGCQMRCLMFWKEAWLEPTDPPSPEEIALEQLSSMAPKPLLSLKNDFQAVEPPRIGEKYSCQATELASIGTVLSGWDPRPYFWDWWFGDRKFGEVLRLLLEHFSDKIRRVFAKKKSASISDKTSKASGTPLNLQPGEWIEVKSYAEIKETLNSDCRLRGLGYSPDMNVFCGKRFRVSSRVERIVIEWTGELKQLSDTVALDLVHCDGSSCRGCPRNCYFLWREDWLKRVDEPK